MENIIVIAIILILLSSASYKIYKDKKNNVKCSGCPSCSLNEQCSSNKEKIK